jgi:hypothetical protein
MAAVIAQHQANNEAERQMENILVELESLSMMKRYGFCAHINAKIPSLDSR